MNTTQTDAIVYPVTGGHMNKLPRYYVDAMHKSIPGLSVQLVDYWRVIDRETGMRANGTARCETPERAREWADSLNATPGAAPAQDENDVGCWHVWVTGDQSSPHTFYSHADARTFAERKSSDGLNVFTDF